MSYVAEFYDVGGGKVQIREYRNDATEFPFLSTIAVSGTVTAALIFHPMFVQDFEFNCEGLSEANGARSWQIHFVRRPGTGDFRSYHVSNTWYSVSLKGRAWIAVDTHQVLRIEHDIARPVPKIRLFRDHVAVDYAPVDFPHHGVQMWLPQRSVMHIDCRGRRYRISHDFTNFKLFWVDTQQQVTSPKEAP